jgi:Rps23 Pro-64 3,4-dihydroxylase Tpa1-like proline 4-hydroxylase
MSPDCFYFDEAYLLELADRLSTGYRSAKPFPHVVIDSFINNERALQEVIAEFPAPKSLDWIHYKQETERKLASRDDNRLGPATRHMLQQFNSSTFCSFLEKLTGIPGLIPDPYFWGGGLHQIEQGGFLKIHSDFNWYERLKLDRRLNVLLYLNKDWKVEYGGHLELWSQDMKRCEQKILPTANRCVIFSTNSNSYHGHPEALTCPEGCTRKSMALYYYSNGRPQDEKTYSTTFKQRPGEKFISTARNIVRQVTPPIILNVIRKIGKTL